jgi:hypothetical protein
MMGLFKWLFGPSIPPAASEWDEKEYNQSLKRQLSTVQVDLIKRADEQSKQKYDEIDRHIVKLKEAKEKIKKLKEAKKNQAATSTTAPEPEPAS